MNEMTNVQAGIELFEIIGAVCGILAIGVSIALFRKFITTMKAVKELDKEVILDKIVKRIKDKQL